MNARRPLCLLLLAASLIGLGLWVTQFPADGLAIYWADSDLGVIRRARLDGTRLADVVTGLSNPRSLKVDPVAGKLYWTDYGSGKIQRANLDGSWVEDLVTQLDIVQQLELDPPAGKLYWVERGAERRLACANLDGTGVQTLVDRHAGEIGLPVGLALDVPGGKLYWTEIAPEGRILRAELNGSQVEQLITGLQKPSDLRIDSAAGKLYWTDVGSSQIQRANLNGSRVEIVVQLADGAKPHGLQLEPESSLLYWTESGSDRIRRARLDGAGVTTLINTQLANPSSLVIAPAPQAPWRYALLALACLFALLLLLRHRIAPGKQVGSEAPASSVAMS